MTCQPLDTAFPLLTIRAALGAVNRAARVSVGVEYAGLTVRVQKTEARVMLKDARRYGHKRVECYEAGGRLLLGRFHS